MKSTGCSIAIYVVLVFILLFLISKIDLFASEFTFEISTAAALFFWFRLISCVFFLRSLSLALYKIITLNLNFLLNVFSYVHFTITNRMRYIILNPKINFLFSCSCSCYCFRSISLTHFTCT